MQKHQWRKHGIDHYKSKPNNSSKASSQVIIGAEGDVHDSLIERNKTGHKGRLTQNDHLYEEQSSLEMKVSNLEHLEGIKPLDLSPSKISASANSMIQWVQQVETLRTPIIPEISTHKKPIEVLETSHQGVLHDFLIERMRSL